MRDRVEVHPVPGNHTTVLQPPQVQQIAGILDDRLTRLDGAA